VQDVPNGNSDRPAVEWIGTRWTEENAGHSEGRGIAEEGPDILMVVKGLEDGDQRRGSLRGRHPSGVGQYPIDADGRGAIGDRDDASVEGEADRTGHQRTRPHEHGRSLGSCGRHEVAGCVHLMVIDQQRMHRVGGREKPADGKPPLDHENGLLGLQPDATRRVVEIPIKKEPRIVVVLQPDERARSDSGIVLGRFRHSFSLA
jgi:hypothetical protein